MGGILDRRFGENDPTMTPEERALERFVREKQRRGKNSSLFDLEDGEGDEQLTHFGRSLSFNGPKVDDFDQADSGVSDEEHEEIGQDRPNKRRRLSESDGSDGSLSSAEDGSELGRPKTKKEVMSEVIAKSKLHKYERQQVKEDDDDLRAELDKGLPDLFALMRGAPRQPPPAPVPVVQSARIHPDRQALLDGKDRSQADKEYDERLHQMALDQRAKPSERTLTEEERLEREAQRLKELEEKRLRRMRGEPDTGEDEAKEKKRGPNGDEDIDEEVEEDNFGLGSGLLGQSEKQQLDVEDEDDFVIEDEDDFVIEDNLIASGSDLDISEDGVLKDPETDSSDDEDDREFVQGLLSKDDAGREGLAASKSVDKDIDGASNGLAYTYPCPQSHDELLDITRNVKVNNLPTVIQRIRALYHPKLHSDNKAKLGVFSVALIDHISFLANSPNHPPFSVLEMLIRHVHSLAKMFPEEIGRAFRSHLKSLHESRATAPTPGDLILLTAIASVFPTSDHFHQVVTPAILCMTRYMSQKIPQSLCDLATGTYLGTLCLQYQRLSRRYIPELVSYTLNALLVMAPVKIKNTYGYFPQHASIPALQIRGTSSAPEGNNRRPRFWAIHPLPDASADEVEDLKIALLDTNIRKIGFMARLWTEKSAFCEVFDPFSKVLQHIASKPCSTKLNTTTLVSVNLQFMEALTKYTPPVHRPRNSYQPHQPDPPILPHAPSPRPPQSPPPRHQNLHSQIRRLLQSLQTLRPRPRPRRTRQAQSGAQARTKRCIEGIEEGCELHGERGVAGEEGEGSAV